MYKVLCLKFCGPQISASHTHPGLCLHISPKSTHVMAFGLQIYGILFKILRLVYSQYMPFLEALRCSFLQKKQHTTIRAMTNKDPITEPTIIPIRSLPSLPSLLLTTALIVVGGVVVSTVGALVSVVLSCVAVVVIVVLVNASAIHGEMKYLAGQYCQLSAFGKYIT